MKTKILLLVSMFFTVALHGQLIVETTGGDLVITGPGTSGFSFTALADTSIGALGVYDSDPTSEGLWNGHVVGLWDMETRELVASVSVPARGAFAVGDYWYTALREPLTLTEGRTYALAAFYADNDFDFALGNVASVATAPWALLGDALLSTGSGFGFPDLAVPGANHGFFGPNILESPIPEPRLTALAGGIALILFVAWRRKRMGTVALFLLVACTAKEVMWT